MQAIRFHTYGGPDVLRCEEVPTPDPKPGDALIRVNAAGVNYVDVYQRSGLYETPLPFTPGVEGVGIVEKAADGWKTGARVIWIMQPGAYAEYAAVPSWRLIAAPEELDDTSAAAALLQGITAQFLTETTYAVRRGDVALVHAGAGGVGLMLIQLLKMKGAKVLTTVSTEEKASLVGEAGADEVIVGRDGDFVEAAKAATAGQGVHVVYDSIGQATFAGSLSAVRPLGTLALFGQASGVVPPIDPLMLTRQGSVFLARPSIAHHIADADSLRQRAAKVFYWIKNGSLKLRIAGRYPLTAVAKAQADLEARRTAGKLVIDIAA